MLREKRTEDRPPVRRTIDACAKDLRKLSRQPFRAIDGTNQTHVQAAGT